MAYLITTIILISDEHKCILRCLKQLECNIKLAAMLHLFHCELLLTSIREGNVQFQLEVNENKGVKFVPIQTDGLLEFYS